jgi:hypothetical protein
MTKPGKEILLAKIDTLYYSFDDVRLQSILTILRDIVNSTQVEEDKELGFTNKTTQ